jgi:hypothetical protein
MSKTSRHQPFQFSLAVLLVLISLICAELALLPLERAPLTRAALEIPISVTALLAFGWLAHRGSTTRLLVVRCMAVGFAFAASGISYLSWLENDGWLSLLLNVPYAILVAAHSLIVFAAALRIERAFDLAVCFASSLLLLFGFALQVNFGDTTYSITIARWIDAEYLSWLLKPLSQLYFWLGFREVSMIIPNVAWFAPSTVCWVVLLHAALRRAPSDADQQSAG